MLTFIILSIIVLAIYLLIKSDSGCSHSSECRYYQENITCDSEPDFCGYNRHFNDRIDAWKNAYIGNKNIKRKDCHK
jgi:hypothetical protein